MREPLLVGIGEPAEKVDASGFALGSGGTAGGRNEASVESYAMSQMTETTHAPPKSIVAQDRAALVRRLIFAALGLGGVAALWPLYPNLAANLGQARLHAPDLALWNAQPLVIKAHVAAAVAAVALGGVMMVSRKGAKVHRAMGWTWSALMAAAAGASLFITGLNGDRWSFIHLLSGWTLFALPMALIAARRHNVALHRRTMMGLFYIGLLVTGAFTFLPGRIMWRLFFG
jgi:uncharacterized membrane protein